LWAVQNNINTYFLGCLTKIEITLKAFASYTVKTLEQMPTREATPKQLAPTEGAVVLA
jgi:hypothetical protein